MGEIGFDEKGDIAGPMGGMVWHLWRRDLERAPMKGCLRVRPGSNRCTAKTISHRFARVIQQPPARRRYPTTHYAHFSHVFPEQAGSGGFPQLSVLRRKTVCLRGLLSRAHATRLFASDTPKPTTGS